MFQPFQLFVLVSKRVSRDFKPSKCSDVQLFISPASHSSVVQSSFLRSEYIRDNILIYKNITPNIPSVKSCVKVTEKFIYVNLRH